MPAPNQPSPENAAAIQLLYDNISFLPHDEYGVINMLPFAHDSAEVRLVRRHVCEAIINLLDINGHIAHDTTPDAQPKATTASIKCSAAECGSELLSVRVNERGAAYVNAGQLITSVSGLNPQCPHAALTLEDMRVHMEQQFWDNTCTECGLETSELSDGLCTKCAAS